MENLMSMTTSYINADYSSYAEARMLNCVKFGLTAHRNIRDSGMRPVIT